MVRKKHPAKEVEKALKQAESKGWKVEGSGKSAHAWGRLFCPFNDKDCRCGEYCIMSIWSTPRNNTDHARNILKAVNKCEKLMKEQATEN